MMGLIGNAVGQATKVATPVQAEKIMPTPKVPIFDVNETLLDLAPLKTSIGKSLAGREDLLPLWFSTMLHYSLVETLSGEYHSFGEIGTAALMMVAETEGIELTYDEAKEAIVTPLHSLPPHPDVVAGLKALRDDGLRIVSLTNSSAVGVETQFRSAGLIDLFEKRYSVDDRWQIVSAAERLVNDMPNAKLHAVKNCSHWVPQDAPEEFTTAVLDFLSQLQQAPA